MLVPRNDFKTIQDLISYWQQCVTLLGSEQDIKVAGYMADVIGDDNFRTWYNEGQGDPLIVELFDLVADLETTVHYRDDSLRTSAWERIYHLLDALAEKYSR